MANLKKNVIERKRPEFRAYPFFRKLASNIRHRFMARESSRFRPDKKKQTKKPPIPVRNFGRNNRKSEPSIRPTVDFHYSLRKREKVTVVSSHYCIFFATSVSEEVRKEAIFSSRENFDGVCIEIQRKSLK